MSRRLTEERFAVACSNATTKLTASSQGKKQFLLRSKKVIASMLEQHRNIDAQKEAKSMIYNQYLADIYDGLVKMISTLAQYSKALPTMGLVPRSLELEIRTVVYLSDRLDEVKELSEIRKMFIGQFGTTLVAECIEENVDKKLARKYRQMNNIEDVTIEALLTALNPNKKIPQQVQQQQPKPQSDQIQQSSSYARFASMNTDESKFPSFDQQNTQSKFPSFDGQQTTQQNQFPSFGSQSENKFPSFDQQQNTQNKFPSFNQQENKFPSFDGQQSTQQSSQQNLFPSFDTQSKQQSQFPSFGEQQQSSGSKFPNFGEQQTQQSQFPSFSTQSQQQPSQQFQSSGVFAPIPSAGTMQPQKATADEDEDLLARMSALRD
ncbi:hypothetical protein EIN_253530 [Entamoeba invadens IP1]|uniref:Uncharacterized protein n=1 Tax=Entamoeba invadens IP1 TaxID=370355 RepID=A0A0A1UGR4_ENTIV|nr:hypothetical protein EIN_253530 [Entamoeba invadens IP1]ELP95079.1 hypothetical protein EIN_253530 [Entamoeba invadens IP1]|eukprot:XP_004261850.1 hypothetical protein EIN_253530 [Entamoeba invadens IP1]